MQIRTRIFLVFAGVILLGFFALIHWLQDDLRPRYMEAQEDPLVDMAQVLAALVAEHSAVPGEGPVRPDATALATVFPAVAARRFEAQIYGLIKDRIDVRVYVTDARGRVVFDSDEGRDLGRDYSRWLDVARTLRGVYGARTTKGDPIYPEGSVMYVAAPIERDGELIGVVSVGKPTRNAERFIYGAIRNLTAAGALAAAGAVGVALVLYLWVSRPLQQLTDYARAVQSGRRVALPRLGRNEISRVGEAMAQMRSALDGKAYIERYVQTLTHELKSPLAAIRGAAELLQEEMEPQDRNRFAGNIRSEVGRVQDLIDRLLELAAIENRTALERLEPVDLAAVARETIEAVRPLARTRGITIGIDLAVDTDLSSGPTVSGDRFLLHQAVRNLLSNAIAFSPAGGTVRVQVACHPGGSELSVADSGPGVPGYARDRVFERFYSLPRPDGGRGTGLGLSFCQEIMALHGGEISLGPRPDQPGTLAVLRFPLMGS
jgi:two-component system sensor histidine kinase CreC